MSTRIQYTSVNSPWKSAGKQTENCTTISTEETAAPSSTRCYYVFHVTREFLCQHGDNNRFFAPIRLLLYPRLYVYTYRLRTNMNLIRTNHDQSCPSSVPSLLHIVCAKLLLLLLRGHDNSLAIPPNNNNNYAYVYTNNPSITSGRELCVWRSRPCAYDISCAIRNIICKYD